jgi:drug/metabolite transporter (DMT)-like permease
MPLKPEQVMPASFLPIALCLFSAVTVAAVNVLVKRGGDVLVTRMLVAIFMALSVLPLVPFVSMPPRETWPLIGLSVVVHWFYQFGVVRALHRGDLSLVFPVMRGLAPLMTAAFAVVLLREHLNLWQTAGLIAASLSIIVFALPTGATDAARKMDRVALFWAVWTAVGVGAYAVVDARAVRAMPETLSFVVALFLLDWVGVTSVAVWQRRKGLIAAVRPHVRDGAIAGLAGSLSYGAAIYAYTLTDAAIVTALRETSVVFAAAMGAFMLKEGFGERRILAALVLASGLVLMQVAA